MNDDRLYQENKEALLSLLKMGMPARVIEEYFQISSATVYNYVQRLQNNREFTMAMQATNHAIPRMLALLTHLKIGRSTQPWISLTKVDKQILETILDKVLESERIINVLEYAERPLLKFLRFEFGPEIPIGYCDLLNYLNPGISYPDDLAVKIWRSHLKDLANGTIELHYFPTLKAWQEATINQLLNNLGNLIRPFILPILPDAIVEKIENIFFPTLPPKEVKLLKKYFGINCEKLSLSQIAAEDGLSSQRVNQKFHAAIRRAKNAHRLELILAIPLTWEKVISLIPVKPNGNAEPLPPSEAARLLIVDLDLSTRALNCLRAIDDVTYLGDLSDFYVDELLNYRNMGKKTVDEIKAVMKKYGVPFRKKNKKLQ
ncbi:MAG: DNA-directed RNA polymerase subunit alpha C-terminal domain-containing protein [Patescibacteria group bacterium]